MVAIASLFLILILSVLVTRVASIALMLTGLSRESARFQARSALTGVGFTTTEAESIVGHPVRRRIVMILMLLGNVGLVTVITSLMVSLLGTQESDQRWMWFAILIGGVVLLCWCTISRWIDRWLSVVIEWALRRWTNLDTRDYARLLHLSDDYGVAEVTVRADDWVANKSLKAMRLKDEGMLVLGIQRPNGEYDGAPRGATVVEVGDTVIVYGRARQVAELDCRCDPDGDELHARAVRQMREDED